MVIAVEREAKPISALLSTLKDTHGEQDVLLSSITVLELGRSVSCEEARLIEKRRAYLDSHGS